MDGVGGLEAELAGEDARVEDAEAEEGAEGVQDGVVVVDAGAWLVAWVFVAAGGWETYWTKRTWGVKLRPRRSASGMLSYQCRYLL